MINTCDDVRLMLLFDLFESNDLVSAALPLPSLIRVMSKGTNGYV